MPTFTEESLNDSLAINTNPFAGYIEDGPFAGAGVSDPAFAEGFLVGLGIRHYRACLRDDLTQPNQPMLMKDAFDQYGLRPMFLLDPRKSGSPSEFVALLKRYAPGLIALIEDPNEVNNNFPPQELNMKYGGKTDEATGAAWQTDYAAVAKSDPATKNIPWVAYTAIFTDYRLARPFAAFEYANIHSYQGTGVPSSSLLSNITNFNNIYPVGATIRPFVPTECGDNVTAEGGAEKEAQLRM